jgi:hypothetical protein
MTSVFLLSCCLTSSENLQDCACPSGGILGDLREVIGELVLLDDEEMIAAGFDQSQVAKSLHEKADPRPRRAHHLRQFFMGNLQFDANTARVFLTHGASQLQQRLTQPLLAIRRHQIGDDLLLVGNAHGQVAHKSFK